MALFHIRLGVLDKHTRYLIDEEIRASLERGRSCNKYRGWIERVLAHGTSVGCRTAVSGPLSHG